MHDSMFNWANREVVLMRSFLFLYDFQDREAKKDEVIEKHGAVYIPTSQHDDVIAGGGTIALELLHQVQK